MGNIFEFIGIPFGYLFRLIYNFSGSYLVALTLFCLMIKFAMLPLSVHQQKSLVSRAKLMPQEKAIRAQYTNKTDEKSAIEMNQKIMELYSKNGFNPVSGCLPLLIQMPILFSLYSIITKPLTYLCGLDATTVANIEARLQQTIQTNGSFTQIQMIPYIQKHLSAFSDLLGNTMLPQFTILDGLIDLSQTPSVSHISWTLIVPMLTLLASYLAMFVRRRLGQGEQAEEKNEMARSMKMTEYTMPLMSVWISFSVPAIIGIYWIIQNLVDVVQQIVLYKVYPIPKPAKAYPEKEITVSQL